MADVLPSQLLLKGATIFDGSGRPPFLGDVKVVGDRIVAVGGNLAPTEACAVTVCTGLALAPGFIDAHTHDDVALLTDRQLCAKVSQGVTSVVAGNCGWSIAPLITRGETPPAPLDAVGASAEMQFDTMADYMHALDRAPPSVNVACLVGHGTLRVTAMSDLTRAAGGEEIAAMLMMVKEAMDAGAIGLSSGLFYPPANAAPAQEVIAILEPVRACAGIYASHIRDEADLIDAALDEAFAIAREADVPLVISHHKVSGLQNFGRSRDTLHKIAQAMTRQEVSLDVYPYAASSTMLNPKSWGAASRTMVTWSTPYPEHAGRDLADVAADFGCSEEEAIERLLPAGGIYFMMDEEDVERILKTPEAMIGSDGIPLDKHPHPRLWGTFTRVLGHYARDRSFFSLEEAIRRMTSLPATRFKLRDRGTIASGFFADLVLFDPVKIADRATFADPCQPSAGIETVFVNGAKVWEQQRHTGDFPGRVLRHEGS